MRHAILLAAMMVISGCQLPSEPVVPLMAGQPVINVHMHAAWPVSDDAAYREYVVAEMNANHIELSVLHITSTDDIEKWMRAEPDRFLASPMLPCPQREPGVLFCFPDEDGWPPLGWMEQGLADGDIGALGEMLFVYAGIAPSGPEIDAYWALAAKYDVPVGVHINRGPPVGAAPRLAGCCADFDSDIGNPALLRPVLERYPGLRIYLQHAGIPAIPDLDDIEYTSETLALMRDYPNVYADMTILNSLWPEEDHAEMLKRFIAEGFGDRIMFGTDNFPAAPIIARLNSFDFLSDDQKRGILYDNAARFFRLEQGTIANHHNR